jgi:hypothetical protein
MTTLRTYGNLAEAGFAKSLLESAGIRAELADEHSYGIGYGPVVSELRLQVGEADLERARQVLDKGPDAPEPPRESVTTEDEARLAMKGSRFPAGIFIAGGIGFLALLFAVSQLREKQRNPDTTLQTYEFDTNNDGKPDQFSSYQGATLRSSTSDRNGDGKPDEWQEYNSRGTAVAASSDNNFDGKVDVWYDYTNGTAKTGRMDTDFNGMPDLIIEYENDLPIRSEYKPNGSRTATRVLTYARGVLIEELVDSDGDGTLDYRVKLDAFSNRSENLPIERPK